MLYLDTSALVKLIRLEAESPSLQAYLQRRSGDTRISSVLARTELVRAVAHLGSTAMQDARRVLSQLHLIDLSDARLDRAGGLPSTPPLGSLDAIHLACAETIAPDLRAVVTYDGRMAMAAQALGLPVEAPA